MSDVNVFAFTGRLTTDATVRTIASGKKVLNASVACNTGYGEYKKTIYVRVQQWGESTERTVQYLTKGTTVGVSGELSRNEWDSKDGKHNVDFVVTTQSICILSSPKNAQPAAGNKIAPVNSAANEYDKHPVNTSSSDMDDALANFSF